MPEMKASRKQRGFLGAVCTLVIGVYAYTARSGIFESLNLNAADAYYNLLVQGFRTGQLSLKKEVPPGLAQLADPYDPVANAPYRSFPYTTLDLSFYKGKFYLYWGVTPALILFWPYAALTGDYLLHKQAVAIFCAIGFLASVGLLHALWRRYFAKVRIGVVAACALALGLATGMPWILSRSEVHEVPVSCAYMLTMLTMGALWCALHQRERSCRWLVAASVAYGLAVGARSSLLFGAVILLVPVIQAWREGRRLWTLLTAAIVPITVIGLGLMLYNALRFDSPLEFGVHYQLVPEGQKAQQYFSLRYLWFNLRVYFFEPARWSGRFPFVREIAALARPTGAGSMQTPFGVLTNIPLVWLALAVPLAWRGRLAEARARLCEFSAATALLFGICALTVGAFFAASMRYEVEFLPALVLLAVVGILGLEHTLRARPVWRRAVRWGWSTVLGFSVAFNLLVGVVNYGESQCLMGNALLRAGKIQDAVRHFDLALRFKPDFAEAHYNLGVALQQTGKIEEAIRHFEQALQLKPDFAEAHYNLGVASVQRGKMQEAIGHYEQALLIKPDLDGAHNSLGVALQQTGRLNDAIRHYEQALRISPGFAEAQYNLAVALQRQGRYAEATESYRKAIELKPRLADAYLGLGRTLVAQGEYAEAVQTFRRGLEVEPRHMVMGDEMAWIMATAPDPTVRNALQAIQIGERLAELTGRKEFKPLDTLGAAYAEAGRFEQAVATAREALQLAEARNDTNLVIAIRSRLELYERSKPYRLPEL